MKFQTVENHYQLDYSPVSRSEGVHASDLYNSLYKTLQPKRYAKPSLVDDPYDPGIIGLGLAWETHFERVLQAAGVQAERPGEFRTKEGVWFTPDLFVTNGHTIGGEIKLTRYAMAPATDARFAKWVTQMKTYGHHLQISRWRLYAFHILGTNNWRDPPEKRNPTLVVTDLEFSKTEMEEEWRLLLSHAKQQRML